MSDNEGKKAALKGLLDEVGSWKKEALRERAPKKGKEEEGSDEDEMEDEDEVVIKLLGKLAKQKKGE
jgi:hypothetical protein